MKAYSLRPWQGSPPGSAEPREHVQLWGVAELQALAAQQPKSTGVRLVERCLLGWRLEESGSHCRGPRGTAE